MPSNDTKICSACGLEKTIAHFAQHGANSWRAQCRPCHAAGRRMSPEDHQRRYDEKMMRRFWGYANRCGADECWLWTGEIDHGGYGVMHLQARGRMKAHRFSWQFHSGPVPDGLFVLHNCDERYPVGNTRYRACVNPAHLRLGTNADNNQDAWKKGRNLTVGQQIKLHPEKFPQLKLTDDQAQEIRQIYACGNLSQREIGEEYGVSQTYVGLIVRGERRPHLPS